MGRSLGVSRVDSDCSHEMKRCLLLGRKAMTNLELIKKQRHHFAGKSQNHGFKSLESRPFYRIY